MNEDTNERLVTALKQILDLAGGLGPPPGGPSCVCLQCQVYRIAKRALA